MRILNDDENYAIKRLNDFALSINAAYLLYDEVPEMNLSDAKDLEKQINVILELIERLIKDIKIKNKQLKSDDVAYYEALRRYFEQKAKNEYIE